MRQTVTFDFYFPAIDGKLKQMWQVTAAHIFIEHPTVDMEGDPANLPDIEERLEDIKIWEMTGGICSGHVPRSDIPTELWMKIIEQGKNVGRAQLHDFFKPETI